jgi:hypothetical protein
MSNAELFKIYSDEYAEHLAYQKEGIKKQLLYMSKHSVTESLKLACTAIHRNIDAIYPGHIMGKLPGSQIGHDQAELIALSCMIESHEQARAEMLRWQEKLCEFVRAGLSSVEPPAQPQPQPQPQPQQKA